MQEKSHGPGNTNTMMTLLASAVCPQPVKFPVPDFFFFDVKRVQGVGHHRVVNFLFCPTGLVG